MALVVTDNKYYAEIANAIREKLGSTERYTPAQMAAAILMIGGGSGLPDGYTLLTYIQSSGTQWVNTGYVLKSENQRVVCDFMPPVAQSSKALFGNQTSSGGYSFSILPYFGSSDAIQFFVGSSFSAAKVSYSANTKYAMDVSAKNNSFAVTINGSTTNGTYNGSLNKTLPIAIFGNCVGASYAQELSSARIYKWQLYDNDVLVRDFVPCLNPSGVAGLYDKVNKAFYGNAGSGTFTIG